MIQTSYKEENDNDDGGFYFEKQLKGEEKFEFLDINVIIALLDGVSCQKKLSQFQADIKPDINNDKLKKRYKKGNLKGFLKVFL